MEHFDGGVPHSSPAELMAQSTASSPAHQLQKKPNRVQVGHIKAVEDALSKGNLTLVIGAGVSIGAVECSTAAISPDDRKDAVRRLGWKGLLLDGLEYLEEADVMADAGVHERDEYKLYLRVLNDETERPTLSTLLRAASFLKGKLVDGNRLPDWLKLEFGDLYDKYIGEGENAMLDAIGQLHNQKARIMTTNYDNFLTRRLSAPRILPDDKVSVQRFFNKNDASGVLHIHGEWSEAQGAVLDGVDYFKVRQNSFVVHSLQACFSGPEVVLFVGTGSGLNDPNFGRLLDWANQELSTLEKRHYILVHDTEGNQRKYLNAIQYGPDHKYLPAFLKRIAASQST